MKSKNLILLLIVLNSYCTTIALAVTPKVKDIQVLSDLDIFYQKVVNKEGIIDTNRFHFDDEAFAFFNPVSDKIERGEVEIQYNYGYNYMTKDDECIALIKPSRTNINGGIRVVSPYCVLQKYCLENDGKWKLDFASSIYDNIELAVTSKEIKNVNILYGSECDGVDGYFNCLSYVYKILSNGKILKVFEGDGMTKIMNLQRHIEQTASYQKGDSIETHYSIVDADKYDEKKDLLTLYAMKEIYLYDYADTKKIYYQVIKVKFKIELIADRFRYYDYKTEILMESIGE
jgi:hypothetical protein